MGSLGIQGGSWSAFCNHAGLGLLTCGTTASPEWANGRWIGVDCIYIDGASQTERSFEQTAVSPRSINRLRTAKITLETRNHMQRLVNHDLNRPRRHI